MNPVQPKFLKGGLVLFDVEAGKVTRILPLMVNPATMSRSYEAKRANIGTGGTLAPLRLIGPAVETIQVEVQLDAADAILRSNAGMSQSGGAKVAADEGVRPWIAAMQMLLTPSSAAIMKNDQLRQLGELEIIPMQQPLTLFVWGAGNILPVVLTSLSVSEEMFDPRLVPVQAKLSLSMKSLSVDDLGVSTRAGSIFLTYLREVERRASLVPDPGLAALGIEGTL
jgi:hypothetical protein